MKIRKMHMLIVFLFVALFLSITSFSFALTRCEHKSEIVNNNIKYIPKEDIVKPDINLVGDNIELKLNEEYIEPGFFAYDNIDGDISTSVIIETNLDTSKIGDYEIKYLVKDSSGNSNQSIRKVKVTSNIKKYFNSKTDNTDINKRLNNLKSKLNAYDISIGYININSNFIFLYNEDKVYFGASLIKTLDAMYIYENNLTNSELREKVKLAISKSDNSAHSYIVNKVGFENIKDYAVKIGGNNLTCHNYFCNTTVTDQLTYLSHLYKLIKNNSYGEELKSYFVNDYGNYLSFDYSFRNLHKYGNSNDYFHDVGIFDTDNPYIVVILTKEKSNGEYYVADLIRSISKEINDLNNLIK